MFNEFQDWLQEHLAAYTIHTGPWEDDPSLYEQFIVSVRASGGGQQYVDVRQPRFSCVFLGRRNTRSDALQVMADVETLREAIDNDERPCGAAIIAAIGEITGPSYTSENRAVVMLDFQITL